jgi:hypothetical protein
MCAEPVHSVRGGGRGGSGFFGSIPLVVRWILGGVLVSVLAVAGCCGLGMWQMNMAMKDMQEEMERAQEQEEADRKARTVVVSAKQLLQEFQDDPAAADIKYKRKYLEIAGVVEREGKDGREIPFIVLNGGDEQAKIKIECFFELAGVEDDERIERLKKGEAVTVRGEYDGRVSNVQLRECVLAK